MYTDVMVCIQTEKYGVHEVFTHESKSVSEDFAKS